MAKKREQNKTGEKCEYVYSSTEVSKYYGLTIKGMEFYESRGLVKPERIGPGKARRYSLSDNYRLYFARLYKNTGFGIPQTIDLLQNDAPAHIETELEKEMVKMRRELFLKKRTLQETERTRNLLRAIDREPFFEVTEEEGFYRLFIRRFQGPHKSSREETQEYRLWNDYLPVSAASLRFPLADCLQMSGEVDTEIGLILRASDFSELGFSESGRTRYIPAGRFLHTVIVGDALALNQKDWLRPAMDYLRKNELTQTGDAFTRMVLVFTQNGREIRCDEAWFPVH